MTKALGLVAVVLAAAVGVFGSWWVFHDRTSGDERGAKRIVLAEVQNDDHLVGTHSKSRLSETAWRADRQELARSLNNVEWAWVERYYRDLAAIRTRVPGARQRLENDEGCTVVTLRVWQYSQSQQFTALRNSHRCSKPPRGP
jgi:hypothetical protein